MFLILILSDAHPTPADIETPGLRAPCVFKWCRELGRHIYEGRVFHGQKPEDVTEFNAAADNAARAYHRVCYPVAHILTPAETAAMGLVPSPPALPSAPADGEADGPSGDFPEPKTEAPPPASHPEEPAQPPPGPLATPQAKREAQRLGIDLETVRGTGAGGIIGKNDVLLAWQRGAGEAPPDSTPGNMRLDQLLAPAT
jgi:pyruvate/2-oxoglutarate dehydrogenase complex dihydrolipoamide acyltransferase (E2) component